MINLSTNDRILILAPHPDDETICTSGILQEACRLNLPVKIVYFTNGDNNEVSFIVYEKHLVLHREEFIHMGEVRREEALSAMEKLGVKEDQLIFLGYPDFGTLHIFQEYWGNVSPFRSMFTHVTQVPYPECLSPGSPYTGESILKDIKSVLFNFKPTKVFCPHPVDMNVDHRSLFLFLQVAFWDLKNEIERPQIYPYLVHALHWPKPRGFYPQLEFVLPPALIEDNIEFMQFELTDNMIEKKREMISCYRSQILYSPHFLYSFARKNELFFHCPEIVLKEYDSEKMNTAKIKEHFYIQSHPFDEKNIDNKDIKSLLFARKDDSLLIKLHLHKLVTKEKGIDVRLCGYKKDVSFSQMPKVRIHIGWKNKMVVHNQKAPFSVKGLFFHLKEHAREITVEFPLKDLNYPDYILSCVRTHARDLSLEATAWRILRL